MHKGSAPTSFGTFDVVHMFASLSAEIVNRADWQDDMRNHFMLHAIIQRNNNSKAKSHLCKKGSLVTSFSICWIRFPAASPPSRRVVPCTAHVFWKNGRWHSMLIGQDTCDRQQLVKVGM